MPDGVASDFLDLCAADGARTTTELARRIGVSNATASAHASALRAAGLLTTTRTGRAVHHRRTALGELPLNGGSRGPETPRGAVLGGPGPS